ncbi:MAG TPA: type 1 glutamine amidotransferase domain-containing protein [Balneolaceae bacterium]|nr:type 1 glutamine amidotransferase domain-containing protein [Balneolaceae bacterium]
MKESNEIKVAILATNGFEEVEVTEPRKALDDAGMKTHLVSPEENTIRAWDESDWGEDYEVDVPLKKADSGTYDALFLPGGVLNPDKLRMNQDAIQFINEFLDAEKPIAAICHGPQLLIETGKLDGVDMTSYAAIKTDVKNAGANWTDEEVVVDEDKKLITSRSPDDIPAFNKKMVEKFREFCSVTARQES